MDFMKIFDQTVREIKREVNLKVLKVPEIEQKVLDATDDEPWGPHGTVMAEIAQATKKYSECQMVMNVLWSRLSESGRNWRYVYKSLAVIEYLVANGSERSVDDIIEHTYQISALSNFEYVEPNGKDMGINVRKKAETIVALLNNKDKIQEIRNKASATRDKYFGVSSTGVTYKTGSASFGSNSSSSGDRYGGFGNSRDSDAASGSYKTRDHFGDDKYVKSTSMPRRGDSLKDSSRHGRVQGATASSKAKAVAKRSDSKKPALTSSKSSVVTSNKYEDDFDDFDPRGTSSSKSAVGSSHEVDLFGQSLAGDHWDMPSSVPNENPTSNIISPGVDLFANAAFVSAPSHVEAGTSFGVQPSVDLFASQPETSSALSSTIDFFAAPDPVPSKPLDLFASQPENKLPEPEQVTTKAIDPYSSAPLNNFDNSHLFGSFSTNAHTLTKEHSQNLTDGPDFFGSFSANADSLPKQQPSQNLAENDGHNNLDKKSGAESKSLSKDAFQVKSGIWADSLSRGLIDLNITAPKMVNLADVGIVGGLTETNEAAQAPSTTSYYAGRVMGAGSGLGGGSSFTSSATELDDMFSNYSGQKSQFDGFPK